MDYENYIQGITSYYQSLPGTQIKFLFFLASNLNQAKVRCNLRYNKRLDVFMAESHQPNTFYIYHESVIKYLVSSMTLSPSGGPSGVYDVTILGLSHTSDVNHGDHITFQVGRRRDGDVIVKCHKTMYTDDGYFQFDRSTKECNFVFKPENIANIEDSLCANLAPLSVSMGELFETHEKLIIKRLCNAMLLGAHGGGNKTLLHPMIMRGGRLYRLRKGRRNGMFIKRGAQRKVYVQKAGAYGEITFMSDAFLDFLSQNMFTPLQQLRGDLETIQILYDEFNELGRRANEYIVIMYDFTTMLRNIFYLETKMALIACYAEKKIADGLGGTLTNMERHTLNRFKQTCRMQLASENMSGIRH